MPLRAGAAYAFLAIFPGHTLCLLVCPSDHVSDRVVARQRSGDLTADAVIECRIAAVRVGAIRTHATDALVTILALALGRSQQRTVLDRAAVVKVLNVLGDFNREGLCIDVDFSLPTERVVRSLNQIIEWRGKPQAIRVDNGPEYINGKLITWAEKHGVRLEPIQPGKPQQNAYIERYNRIVHGEWLSQYIFEKIEEAQN